MNKQHKVYPTSRQALLSGFQSILAKTRHDLKGLHQRLSRQIPRLSIVLPLFLLPLSGPVTASVEQFFGFVSRNERPMLRSGLAPVVDLPVGWQIDDQTSLRDQVRVVIPTPASKLPHGLTLALIARPAQNSENDWLARFGIDDPAARRDAVIATKTAGDVPTYLVSSDKQARRVAAISDGDYLLAFVLMGKSLAELAPAWPDFQAMVASYQTGDKTLRTDAHLHVVDSACQAANEESPGNAIPLDKVGAFFSEMESDPKEGIPQGTGKNIVDRQSPTHCTAVNAGVTSLLGELARPRQAGHGVVGVSVNAAIYGAITQMLCRLHEEQTACAAPAGRH